MPVKSSGLSLIELLTSLCIASLLAGFAFPASEAFVKRLSSDTKVDEFRAAINMARHTAIALNTNVIMCPKADAECGPRNSWHQGTLIFADQNGDRRPGTDELVVAVLPPLKSGRIYWRAFRNRSYLKFTGSGVTDWQNGHLLFCPTDNNPELARQVTLNYAGRTYSSHDNDGDGVHEDAHGEPIVCPGNTG